MFGEGCLKPRVKVEWIKNDDVTDTKYYPLGTLRRLRDVCQPPLNLERELYLQLKKSGKAEKIASGTGLRYEVQS